MKTKMQTPMKAIRAKCRECSYNQAKEIRLCPIVSCPLYPYRMGKNPKRKGITTSAQVPIQKTQADTTKIEQKGQLNEQ